MSVERRDNSQGSVLHRIMPAFFSADAEEREAQHGVVVRAFEDLRGRFGVDVIGTFDDDRLMVGSSAQWPWTLLCPGGRPRPGRRGGGLQHHSRDYRRRHGASALAVHADRSQGRATTVLRERVGDHRGPERVRGASDLIRGPNSCSAASARPMMPRRSRALAAPTLADSSRARCTHTRTGCSDDARNAQDRSGHGWHVH